MQLFSGFIINYFFVKSVGKVTWCVQLIGDFYSICDPVFFVFGDVKYKTASIK